MDERLTYNENEPFAAEWLQNLIDAGHIAFGDVDDRDIRQVRPADVRGTTQAHFFAGIGGWSYALRLAGWPDDRPVWTGSCPCQPFSVAGRGRGVDDERHLWPVWRELIAQCMPPAIFGEQVASPAGRSWLSDVRADLEALGYAVGAADLCAAGVGAPHLRQRLYWVAHRGCAGLEGQRAAAQRGQQAGGLANRHGERREGVGLQLQPGEPRQVGAEAPRGGETGGLGHSDGGCGRDAGAGAGAQGESPCERFGARRVGDAAVAPGATSGAWGDAEWWLCRDGKARPAQPGAFPLADGVPARVGRLRAYGNAIVPQLAAAFIQAVMR